MIDVMIDKDRIDVGYTNIRTEYALMRSQDSDSLFGTFKKSSISEDIVDNLLSLIRERELRPGDKLPPERELAAMMQVSRPSLREALRALAIMNIIEIRQGDGTYIPS